MKLLTTAQRDRLIANFRANQRHHQETDYWPEVKLFTPDAGATWLFTKFDPIEELFFGLCDLDMGFPELGYVSLAELTALRGRLQGADGHVAEAPGGVVEKVIRRQGRRC